MIYGLSSYLFYDFMLKYVWKIIQNNASIKISSFYIYSEKKETELNSTVYVFQQSKNNTEYKSVSDFAQTRAFPVKGRSS